MILGWRGRIFAALRDEPLKLIAGFMSSPANKELLVQATCLVGDLAVAGAKRSHASASLALRVDPADSGRDQSRRVENEPFIEIRNSRFRTECPPAIEHDGRGGRVEHCVESNPAEFAFNHSPIILEAIQAVGNLIFQFHHNKRQFNGSGSFNKTDLRIIHSST